MPVTPQSLAQRFPDVEGLRFEAGRGGLTAIRVQTELAEAEIYLHGAHVTHFKPAQQAEPVLFRSEKSVFDPGKAIRGGIPICFPWFGAKADAPGAPSHGLVRTAEWDLASATHDPDGTVRLEFSCDESIVPEAGRWGFKGSFRHTYELRIDQSLRAASTVTNTGQSPLTYELALHTYLRVSDAKQVAIAGFEGGEFVDQLQDNATFSQRGEPAIDGEVDRIYQGHAGDVTLLDSAFGRTLRIHKTGSASTVLWNPHVAKSRRLADLGDDEWPSFICVETAAIAEQAITLAPGENHTVSATISVDEEGMGNAE